MKLDKLFFAIIFINLSSVYAVEFSGSVKSFPQISKYRNQSNIRKKWQNSFKLNASENLSDNLHLEGMLELSSFTEIHSRILKNNYSYRVKDFSPYIKKPNQFQTTTTSLESNLNKLNISYKHPKFDFSIGRQINTFGVSKTISPNDVLVPTQINSLDKEDRTGVDSMNLKVPLDELSMIESGLVFGEDFDQNKGALFIRPKFHVEEWDIALMAMEFKKDRLMGLELQHPFMEAGLFLETQWIETSETYLKDFNRSTLGLDYKFPNSFYYSLEYHYNGSSIKNRTRMPKEYIFLKNYHYLAFTNSYEVTPLLTFSSQNYFNFFDKSILTHLKLDYNLTENSYLGLGTYLGIGKPTSEFRNFGSTWYTSIRYYF